MANAPARSGKSGEVQSKSAFNKYVDILHTEAELSAVDGKSVAAAVTEKIYTADTLEEAFAAQDQGLASGKDLVDVELEVRAFDIVKSDDQFKDGSPLGVYVRVTDCIRLDTLEEVQWATGAPNVVNILWKARNMERLPLECVIKGKVTANGTLLMLRPLARRPIPAEPQF